MYAQDELENLLKETAGNSLLPELTEDVRKAIVASSLGKDAREWADEALEQPIPVTTQDDYDEFKRSGAREPYQKPYFGKRTMLCQHVIGAWLFDDQRHVDRAVEVLESIFAEPTWVVPAHEKPQPWNVDLFASETASSLAYTDRLIGERLPGEVRARLHEQVKQRVLDPYLEHAHDYWWDSGRNNWTGVCAGSIGEATLLLEKDPVRQAKALEAVLDQFGRFIEIGFEEDGGCLEGIGYWNYGLSHYVALAEMLRSRTGGAIDLLAHDKFVKIARYPDAVALGPHLFASFADAHHHASLQPYIAFRLAERTGVESLRSHVGGWQSFRVGGALRNLLWWRGAPTPEPVIEDAFLPVSGIAKCVGTTPGGERVVVCAKGGHNAEPHNNNDVGSFLVCVGRTIFVCDPGPGRYTRDYFSSKRYENTYANSYGHSVPRIAGRLQRTGRKRRGAVSVDGKTITIEFAAAYDVEKLKELTRTLRLRDDGTVTLEDRFRFDGNGAEVEEALMTWSEAEADGAVLRLTGGGGTFEVTAESGTFSVEELKEACEANRKPLLRRATVTYPAAPETSARFTMRYEPKP